MDQGKSSLENVRGKPKKGPGKNLTIGGNGGVKETVQKRRPTAKLKMGPYLHGARTGSLHERDTERGGEKASLGNY